MEYNSDYEVRLATLGALGGDTIKKYDSVYSIDLEILKLTEQGGGGSSAGIPIVEALSAVTNPTNGMVVKLISKQIVSVNQGICVSGSGNYDMVSVLRDGSDSGIYLKKGTIGFGYDGEPASAKYRMNNNSTIVYNNPVSFNQNGDGSLDYTFTEFHIYPINNETLTLSQTSETLYIAGTLPATSLEVYKWIGDFIYDEFAGKWLWHLTMINERTTEEKIDIFRDVMYYGANTILMVPQTNNTVKYYPNGYFSADSMCHFASTAYLYDKQLFCYTGNLNKNGNFNRSQFTLSSE